MNMQLLSVHSVFISCHQIASSVNIMQFLPAFSSSYLVSAQIAVYYSHKYSSYVACSNIL